MTSNNDNAVSSDHEELPPSGPFKAFSDEQASRQLDLILQLRADAVRHPEAAWDLAPRVAAMVTELIEGVAGWAVSYLGNSVDAATFSDYSLEAQRDLIATHLRLPIMQPGAALPLRDALIALKGGQINSILQPANKQRHGGRPHDVACAELTALMWIRWQFGQGRKKYEAQRDVSDAFGVGSDAIKKWKIELGKYFSPEHVTECLNRAERAGRAIHASRNETTQPQSPDGREEGILRMTNLQMRSRPLDVVAKHWKQAKEANG